MAQSWNRHSHSTKSTSQAGIENDFIIKLEKDPSAPPHVHDQLIRESLANQRCVIVRACHEGPETFSKEEIGADVGGLSRIVQWNGQYNYFKTLVKPFQSDEFSIEDAKAKVSAMSNRESTLGEFIDLSNNPDICGVAKTTCLRSSCPAVIRCVFLIFPPSLIQSVFQPYSG